MLTQLGVNVGHKVLGKVAQDTFDAAYADVPEQVRLGLAIVIEAVTVNRQDRLMRIDTLHIGCERDHDDDGHDRVGDIVAYHDGRASGSNLVLSSGIEVDQNDVTAPYQHS